MKLVSKRTYRATPTELWQIVHDPLNMPAWNPKCIHCEKLEGPGNRGAFRATFDFNGKQSDARGTVVKSEPNQEIRFRYEYEASARLGVVEESFQIAAKGWRRTQLKHTVDFSQSTLPRWVKWIIGFVGRFGGSVGTGPLDEIAKLLPGE